MNERVRSYWRIDPELISGAAPPSLMAEPANFIKDAKIGDGVVWAQWDSGAECGLVSALGIITDRSSDGVVIDWRPKVFPINPGPQGAQQWEEKRTVFRFSSSVVKERNLPFHFERAFSSKT